MAGIEKGSRPVLRTRFPPRQKGAVPSGPPQKTKITKRTHFENPPQPCPSAIYDHNSAFHPKKRTHFSSATRGKTEGHNLQKSPPWTLDPGIWNFTAVAPNRRRSPPNRCISQIPIRVHPCPSVVKSIRVKTSRTQSRGWGIVKPSPSPRETHQVFWLSSRLRTVLLFHGSA